MNSYTKLLSGVAGILGCLAFTQCDESSFIGKSDVNADDAYIRLNLSVADTRSGEDETEDSQINPEEILKAVDVYIFDKDGTLEKIESNFVLSDGKSEAVIPTSAGPKTVYAIAGMKSGWSGSDSPTKEITTLSAFKSLKFKSKYDDIFDTNGCLMIGSGNANIAKSSQSNIPFSNRVSMSMERATAKASVSFQKPSVSSEEAANSSEEAAESSDVTTELSGLGFTFSDLQYCVCQTSDIMPVEADLAYSIGRNSVDGEPTYTNLTNPYKSDGISLDFKAAHSDEGENIQSVPQYMAENISQSHVSGNTTFVALSMKAMPSKLYQYQNVGEEKTLTSSGNSNPNALSEFYAVGKENAESGLVEYALNDSNEPYCFVLLTEAEAYADEFNTLHNLSDSGQFQVIRFTGCRVYYRVNFNTPANKDARYGKHSVIRNTHYKLSVNSVNRLGFSSESLLFPTNSESSVDIESAYYLNAGFSITPWTDVDQPVGLE